MGVIAIVFFFVTIIIVISNIHDERMKKMKIEAALREAEMDRGYAPGTYSRTFSSRQSYKEFQKEMKRRKKSGDDGAAFKSEREEREELEKGIRDLEKRIENIDLIMKEKNRKREGGDD